jgi:hypothetical protein
LASHGKFFVGFIRILMHNDPENVDSVMAHFLNTIFDYVLFALQFESVTGDPSTYFSLRTEKNKEEIIVQYIFLLCKTVTCKKLVELVYHFFLCLHVFKTVFVYINSGCQL